MRDNDTQLTTRLQVRRDHDEASGCVDCPIGAVLKANPNFLADLQRLIAERRAERKQWEIVTGSAGDGRRAEPVS